MDVVGSHWFADVNGTIISSTDVGVYIKQYMGGPFELCAKRWVTKNYDCTWKLLASVLVSPNLIGISLDIERQSIQQCP